MSDDLTRFIRQTQRRLGRTAAKAPPIYLENTFTPTYIGSVTAGTTTYTTQVGEYTRIGRVVVATLNLVWTNATGTGFARLGGLPFTSANITSIFYTFQPQTNFVTFANGSIEGLLLNNSTQGTMTSPATNAANTELAIEVAGTLRATIIYFMG